MIQVPVTDAPPRENGARNGAAQDNVRLTALHRCQISIHFAAILVSYVVSYTGRAWTVAIYRLLVLATGGLFGLIGRYSPSARLWSLQVCYLRQAEFAHVNVSCAVPDSIIDYTLITRLISSPTDVRS